MVESAYVVKWFPTDQGPQGVDASPESQESKLKGCELCATSVVDERGFQGFKLLRITKHLSLCIVVIYTHISVDSA